MFSCHSAGALIDALNKKDGFYLLQIFTDAALRQKCLNSEHRLPFLWVLNGTLALNLYNGSTYCSASMMGILSLEMRYRFPVSANIYTKRQFHISELAARLQHQYAKCTHIC